jgi:hypothetical protein
MGCLMLVFWWLSFWNGVKGEAPMSDNEMKSTEKTDTRTVNIRAEIWHALPEIAGRQIDPATAEVCSIYCQVLDPYGV